MTHEILEKVYSLILKNIDFSTIELNLMQYKDLKKELGWTDDKTSFLNLTLIIKEVSTIYVK